MTDIQDPDTSSPGVDSDSGNFWSDPDLQIAANSGRFMKFNDPGDRLQGTVAALGKHTWDNGSVAPQVHFVESDVPTLTASQVMLQRGLYALKPLQGDLLEVELVQVESRPGDKTLKHFVITVTRSNGTTEKFPPA